MTKAISGRVSITSVPAAVAAASASGSSTIGAWAGATASLFFSTSAYMKGNRCQKGRDDSFRTFTHL